MQTITDMLGRTVRLSHPPQRIISLVPSQTELLYDLGLGEEVIGITRFCVHPQEWYRNKKRVGGTKSLHLDVIRSLSPDLLIANKEENDHLQIEELMRDFPVWVSDIYTIEDALQMISSIGELVGRKNQASVLINEISEGFASLKPLKKKRIAYLIWYNPWMAVGNHTFIHDVLETLGWTNVFADKQRYPIISINDLRDQEVDTLLLSSEPFPFGERHKAELLQQLPGLKVCFVDGEMFSWYGSRMRKAASYFHQLLSDI